MSDLSYLKYDEVFKPGLFPEYTYVSRKSPDVNFTYELRLKQALKTAGFLTSIIGPSKTGKTVLCEKVIGIDSMVSITGSDLKNRENFWNIVAAKVGLSVEGEYSNESTLTEQTVSGYKHTQSSTAKEKYVVTKDLVIDYFKSHELVLVLDDFHYASEELQLEIAHQLKDAIRKEFKVVIISLPHRADDAIRKNPDLTGRLNLINIEPWKMEELKSIAIIGFKKLQVPVNEQVVERMAAESLTSPQLMQSICLNLCLLSEVDETHHLNEDLLEQSYKFTTINLPYKEVIQKIQAGPSTRGQKRKKYQSITHEELDVYGIILAAIALDPPSISITIDNLKDRVDELIISSEKGPDKSKLKDTLDNIQTIMTESASIYQVFEWKDNKIYILEPLFLFYLRWGI